MNDTKATKGQLISEWICEFIISSKIRTKNCQDFCPHYTGHQSWQFFLGETIFCPYFGRKDDFIHSFWNCLIFNGIPTTSCEIVIRYFLFHHSGAVVVDGHYVMKNVKMVWHTRENARFWLLINQNKKIMKKMVKSNVKHIFQTTIFMPYLRNRDTSKSFQ